MFLSSTVFLHHKNLPFWQGIDVKIHYMFLYLVIIKQIPQNGNNEMHCSILRGIKNGHFNGLKGIFCCCCCDVHVPIYTTSTDERSKCYRKSETVWVNTINQQNWNEQIWLPTWHNTSLKLRKNKRHDRFSAGCLCEGQHFHLLSLLL